MRHSFQLNEHLLAFASIFNASLFSIFSLFLFLNSFNEIFFKKKVYRLIESHSKEKQTENV